MEAAPGLIAPSCCLDRAAVFDRSAVHAADERAALLLVARSGSGHCHCSDAFVLVGLP